MAFKWWENPASVAKRRATLAKNRKNNAKRLAERVVRRWIPDPEDARICREWLQAKKINIEDPDMRPVDRLKWVRRAKREMVDLGKLSVPAQDAGC